MFVADTMVLQQASVVSNASSPHQLEVSAQSQPCLLTLNSLLPAT